MAPKPLNPKPAPEGDPDPQEAPAVEPSAPETPAPREPVDTVPEEPPVPPRPHVVHAAWYPAGIVLPGPERRIMTKVKIFAADTGLYVFTSADESAPTWWSPILYEETPRPKTGIMAANGVSITTKAGKALITPMGGCGCGSALKRWVPSWAVRESPWPTSG